MIDIEEIDNIIVDLSYLGTYLNLKNHEEAIIVEAIEKLVDLRDLANEINKEEID